MGEVADLGEGVEIEDGDVAGGAGARDVEAAGGGVGVDVVEAAGAADFLGRENLVGAVLRDCGRGKKSRGGEGTGDGGDAVHGSSLV